MKFTLSWLKEHLATDAQIDDIVERVTMIGLEVEDVENAGAKLAPFSVARIISAARHPNADKLQVCQVETKDGQKEIVCGAPNARAGLVTAYAPVGARIPGSGITLPVVLAEKKPAYTADAMRAKVQGSVWLECIVMPDGTVGDVKVTRSLDPIFGLDQEAIKAAKQWRFRPGMRQGSPVPVIITIELTFTLR